MKYCNKCKIETDYSENICPLCQNVITGSSESVFPFIPDLYKENKLFFKILMLVCILVALISVFLNIIIPTKVNFSIFVVCGIVCFLLILKIGLAKRYNISKTILWQVVIVSVLSFLWDYFNGFYKWSITYVIPIVCVIGSLNIVFLLKIFKKYIEDYLIYFIIVALLGFVPIIFLTLNLVTTDIPSLICIFISAILFILMIVFRKNDIIDELRRRLHI